MEIYKSIIIIVLFWGKECIYAFVRRFSRFFQVFKYAWSTPVFRYHMKILNVLIVILSGIPSTEETMSSLLTVIQSSSQSHLGSQYSECPVSEWNSGGNSTNATSSNGQVGSVCFLHCCVVFDKRCVRINWTRVFLRYMDACCCSFLNQNWADANLPFISQYVLF